MKGLGIELTIGVPAAVRRLEQERDGLRVQLADAQDRLALCAAEVQRRTQAMPRAAADQAVVARLEAAWTRIVELRRERDGWRGRWRDEVGTMRRERTEMEGRILALTTERDEAWSRWRKIQGALQTTREDLAGVVEEVLAERDAAQARSTELLAEAQMLRRRVEEAENTREDHLLRCEAAARDGAARAEKAERARDGWRGRALTAEVNVLGVRIGTYGRRCPGCRGCNAGATAADVCGGSAWVAADTKTSGAAREISPEPQPWSVAWFERQGLSVREDGPGRITVYAPGRAASDLATLDRSLRPHCPVGSRYAVTSEGPPSKPDPEIPLTAMRRERDEALALVQKLRDFADDEQKRATFFQVEESKALDRVLKAEKERDEALAGVAKLAQAARAFVACFDWHAGQIFLARTGTESEAVEALQALRYALPAPPLAPLGTAPGGYEAESADEDTTEPTPEEMPRAPTASDVRRMFAAMDEGASSREKPDA